MSRTVVVVSPHLDDALLSCGQLLAALPKRAALVATVFAGEPDDGDRIWTDYDRKCGFPSARVAVAARRAEDRRACSVLGCRWEHLALVDSQYASQPRREQVADAIARVVDRLRSKGEDVGTLVGPLGLQHVDHRLVAGAFLDVAGSRGADDMFLYEELPYRVEWPEQVPGALALAGEMFHVERAHIGGGALPAKTAAVACYRSQQWAWDGHSHLVPERFWRLKPKGAADGEA